MTEKRQALESQLKHGYFRTKAQGETMITWEGERLTLPDALEKII